jgi:hypothetical protein
MRPSVPISAQAMPNPLLLSDDRTSRWRYFFSSLKLIAIWNEQPWTASEYGFKSLLRFDLELQKPRLDEEEKWKRIKKMDHG